MRCRSQTDIIDNPKPLYTTLALLKWCLLVGVDQAIVVFVRPSRRYPESVVSGVFAQLPQANLIVERGESGDWGWTYCHVHRCHLLGSSVRAPLSSPFRTDASEDGITMAVTLSASICLAGRQVIENFDLRVFGAVPQPDRYHRQSKAVVYVFLAARLPQPCR